MFGRQHYFSIIVRRQATIRLKINESHEPRTDLGTCLLEVALHSPDTATGLFHAANL